MHTFPETRLTGTGSVSFFADSVHLVENPILSDSVSYPSASHHPGTLHPPIAVSASSNANPQVYPQPYPTTRALLNSPHP
ncbi:hypothetical protein SAMN05421543_101356 [Alicyclobacillus macrosporangiidus]|uniref:Uncharacterized protein n=1 Tax=Alicyclobacillus macrosporangiidus TaxID=392015 RepID=A0A1I7FN78_9BACL|nr:hypothetical protein SAMN05421543_101356 [Alicyclobacillus macrosporangiidus]